MKRFLQKILIYAILLFVLVGLVYGLFNFAGYGQLNLYSFVFSRTVDGVVENVEKVLPGMAVVGGSQTNKDLFSFAVGIRDKDGDIVTGTSEDRQWAIVQKGQCARAKFYPYPPWDLDKSGTYFNVRLMRLYACASGATTLTAPAPAPSSSAQAGAAVVQSPVPAETAH